MIEEVYVANGRHMLRTQKALDELFPIQEAPQAPKIEQLMMAAGSRRNEEEERKAFVANMVEELK